MKEKDLVAMGTGVGGYVRTIRASQLGLKTMLVEKARLGPECLKVGPEASDPISEAALAIEMGAAGESARQLRP
jgi:hypothetical protein